jgi:hypothetical protein
LSTGRAALKVPQPFVPEHAPDEPLSAATICAALAALRDQVPALRAQVPGPRGRGPDVEAAKTPVNEAILRGVAELLNQASPPSPRKRSRRSRSAASP